MTGNHKGTERKLWWGLLAAAAVGLGLAFIGFAIDEAPGPLKWWNVVWRTLALLVMQSDGDDGGIGPVAIARVLLSVAAIGTLVNVAWDFLGKEFNLARIYFGSYPTVIVGLSKEALSFARNSVHPCVLLDPACPVVLQPPAAGDVRQVPMGPDEDGALEGAGIGKADSILILGRDDSANLATLGKILAKRRNNAKRLRIAVRIGNRELAQRLELDQDFVLPHVRSQPEDDLEVTPFRADSVAARLFLREYPLVDMAELRGQNRVHLVMVGWTPFAFDVLEQLARLSPYSSFDRPRVDIFVQDRAEVRATFAAVQPVFRDAKSPPGPAGAVEPLEIQLHDVDTFSHLPSPAQIHDLEPHGILCVTATLVSLGSDAASIAAALALRDTLAARQQWQGPLFVKVDETTPLTESLAIRARQADESDRIVPIGSLDEVCRIAQMAGQRDEVARRVHQAYLQSKGIDQKPENERGPNEADWKHLAPVYRQSNRRAADHMPIKLLSSGFILDSETHRIDKGDALDDPAGEIDHLAELEHRSWEIDLLLKGWRAGKERDRSARINEYIGIPYRQLTPGVRQWDIDQVKLLDTLLREGDGPVTARREFRIAAFGHNDISAEDETRAIGNLGPQLDALAAKYPRHCFSIFTPLAPGADLVLTQAIAARLRGKNLPHRIVTVRSLPPSVVLREYGKQMDQPTAAAQARIDSFFAEMLGHNTPVAIANLLPACVTMEDWSNEDNRQRAFRRANSYLATRCDAFVIFQKRDEQKPGGTAEASAWARTPSSIPLEFRFPARRRAPGAPEVIQLS